MELRYMNTTENLQEMVKVIAWNNNTFLITATSDIAINDSNNTTAPQVATVQTTDDQFGHAMKQINIYLTPMIIFVGIVTNLLSFCVFVLTHLRIQSSSVYLATLALSDTGFLFALFLSWFSWIKIHLIHQPFWCQIIIYMTYACSFVSVYSVVGFTCERFIAVLYPLHRKRLCTRKNAIIVEVIITLFALIVYSFYLWTTTITYAETGESFCVPRDRFRALISVMTNFDSVMTLIVPSAIIITLNIRIGYTVYHVVQWRNNLRESQRPVTRGGSATGPADSSSEPSPNRINGSNHKVREDSGNAVNCDHQQHSAGSTRRRMATTSQLRTTRMLLLVSSVFVLLNLPSHVFRIHGLVLQLLNKQSQISATMTHWQELCQIIYYLNFATNFFLYSFSARSFREALKRLIKRARSKAHKMSRFVQSCVDRANARNDTHEHIPFGKYPVVHKRVTVGTCADYQQGPRTV